MSSVNKELNNMELLEKDLTGKIISACFEVSNELGVGFLESGQSIKSRA